jgi:hypothetical protein
MELVSQVQPPAIFMDNTKKKNKVTGISSLIQI